MNKLQAVLCLVEAYECGNEQKPSLLDRNMLFATVGPGETQRCGCDVCQVYRGLCAAAPRPVCS